MPDSQSLSSGKSEALSGRKIPAHATLGWDDQFRATTIVGRINEARFVSGKDLAAGGAKLANILLQALVDLPAVRYELFTETIHVGLASRLLLLGAFLGYRMRSRETKRRR